MSKLEMAIEEQSAQPRKAGHLSRRISMKHALKFLSALILPLLLGVFTVVITFQQRNMARDQWLHDRIESREKQQHDRNESQNQRQQELDIANRQEASRRGENINQYQDVLLVNYIKEMGDLLKESNGSLMSNPITSILARVKTLNVFRQLEGKRAALILRFLYESRQLTDTNKSKSLDISTATVTEVDPSVLKILPDIGPLLLRGIILKNFTSGVKEMKNVSFTSALLENVDFSCAEPLQNVQFSSARLYNAQFSSARLDSVDFSSAKWLGNVTFSSSWLDDVSFSSAWLDNVDFSSAIRLDNLKFSSAWLKNVTFSYARLDNVDFSSAIQFFDVRFTYAWLDNVDFSSVQLENVDFSSAELISVNFSYATFGNVCFSISQTTFSFLF